MQCLGLSRQAAIPVTKESLEQEKVPRCFLCKFELAGPLVADDDFSLATFARKFSEWRRKDKNKNRMTAEHNKP